MKSVTAAKRKRVPTFAENYASALGSYLLDGGESSLRRGYELGREAMTGGTSLVEVVLVHQETFIQALHKRNGRTRLDRLSPRATEFLAEVLSPFEMANRGFQEAVSALRRMNELLEEEIKRIAYGVHDEAGQLLVAVHLALSSLERQSAPQLKSDFENVNMLLKQVETQLREYSHELRPTILDDLGLVPAIHFLATSVSARSAVPIRVSADLKSRVAPAIEIALYRVLQEALNNVVKHARASAVAVELSLQAGLLCCKVQDDGIGFNPAIAQKSGRRTGLGLVSMKERINSIGGTLDFESSSGRGTTLVVRVPINSSEVKHVRSHSSRG
ncbi:MAG TPA: ATP-binding protein [Candidatus Acidoferrum sp.]|nr:ATP-binding protein [Candidatus Acidoferrum sp.]